MHKEWYYKRKVTGCQGIKQTFIERVMHTSRRPPSSPPRPHNRKNGEGAAVPVCTSARRSFYLARGQGGTRPLSTFASWDMCLFFSVLCSTWNNPIIIFFSRSISIKKRVHLCRVAVYIC